MAQAIYGRSTEAFGADPSDFDKTYTFKYKVQDINSLITSHSDTLTPNPNYPQELQPRIRDRAASRLQIERMAANLNPRALLHDSGFLDTGLVIIGKDDVVESGNGRVLALRRALREHPEKYRLYQSLLEKIAPRYGLKVQAIKNIQHPVLVRERTTKVNRVDFAAEANIGAVMSMSPFEQARQDASRLSDNIINTIQIGEQQSIDQALKAKANSHIVNHFISTVPANERATIADAKGNVNITGLQRLKLAIFTKTYTGESGQRLARIFSENVDPVIKSIENSMFQTLPDMAKAESLIASNLRERNLSVAPDLAEVIDTYASLKQADLTVRDFLSQSTLFEERLNPFQKQILEHLDLISHSPKKVREFVRDTAQAIEASPVTGQVAMVGLDIPAPTKEQLINDVINRQRIEFNLSKVPIATSTAPREELAQPDEPRVEVPGRVGRRVRERPPTVARPKKRSKAEPNTKEALVRIHETRSTRSKATDEARKHSVVVRFTSPLVNVWKKDKGRMDIRGIDTPRRRTSQSKTPSTGLRSVKRGRQYETKARSVKRGRQYETKARGGKMYSRRPL